VAAAAPGTAATARSTVDAVAAPARNAVETVADTAREATGSTAQTTRQAAGSTVDAADQAAGSTVDTAREVVDDAATAAASVVAEAEATVRRAHAEASGRAVTPSAAELPINGYAQLTAAEIVERLRAVSQEGLQRIDRYERAHQHRSTVLTRVGSLLGEAPWPGYDEQTVVEVRRALAGADGELKRTVRAYETRHKNRQGVLDVTAD
jgi:hypothetical protein